jgi:hypothetical protein
MQTAALQGVLAKFGIREIARTGKIALKRGEHLLEMGGWGDGVARRAKERQNVNVGEDGAQVSTAGEPASSSAQEQDRFCQEPVNFYTGRTTCVFSAACVILDYVMTTAEAYMCASHAAMGYKGEQAPEGADVYTVNNNGGPGAAKQLHAPRMLCHCVCVHLCMEVYLAAVSGAVP